MENKKKIEKVKKSEEKNEKEDVSINYDKKRKVTPEKEPTEKKRKVPLFMGCPMDELFKEAEEKKDTCFIYIPKYAR